MSSPIHGGTIPDVPGQAEAGDAALVQGEIEDVMEDLRAVRKKKRRHAVWAFLGFSPAAVLPAAGLLLEGSLGLVILLSGLVTVTQGYGWVKSLKREEELEESLRSLISKG